jgi:hypothetical protein
MLDSKTEITGGRGVGFPIEGGDFLYGRAFRMYRHIWALFCVSSIVGCGSSPSPTQPGTTTTTAVTTSGAPAASHYVGVLTPPPPQPQVPLDLSLFFGLPGGATLRGTIKPQAIFAVTGGYNTGPGGFTGTVRGTLDGSIDNGIFTGVVTANLAIGCLASRNYSGPLTHWQP